MTDDEIVVRLVSLPDGVRGYVTESPDGCKNVYLNQNLTKEGLREIFDHEMDHIKRCDLSSGCDFLVVEGLA